MSLTDQEQRCVNLACRYLALERGGRWVMDTGPTLDERYPSIASPEILVGNGAETAAIEVKRLTGDSGWQEYQESLRSLCRSLVPSYGGFYHLDPSINFRLPIDRPLRKTLKREIERVAAGLQIGQSTPVRIPRKGLLRSVSSTVPGILFCNHNYSSDLVRSLGPRLPGAFWLHDGGWEHSFISDQAREDFLLTVYNAALQSQESGSAPVTWYEEWKLIRDDSTENGVWIVAATEASSPQAAVAEATANLIEKGLRKFTRRWADLHVFVVENAWIWTSLDRLRAALSNVGDGELPGIDLILLVDNEDIDAVWRRSSERQ